MPDLCKKNELKAEEKNTNFLSANAVGFSKVMNLKYFPRVNLLCSTVTLRLVVSFAKVTLDCKFLRGFTAVLGAILAIFAFGRKKRVQVNIMASKCSQA